MSSNHKFRSYHHKVCVLSRNQVPVYFAIRIGSLRGFAGVRYNNRMPGG